MSYKEQYHALALPEFLCDLRFSIVTSYVEYGHYITGLQVVSLCLVFGALFFKSLLAAF